MGIQNGVDKVEACAEVFDGAFTVNPQLVDVLAQLIDSSGEHAHISWRSQVGHKHKLGRGDFQMKQSCSRFNA